VDGSFEVGEAMRLKVLIGSDGIRRIASEETGEIVENVAMVTSHDINTGQVTILVYGTDITFERVENIVDADERAVRALPAASQSHDPFDFLKDYYDFDPLDYEDYPRDDEEEQEDDEDED